MAIPGAPGAVTRFAGMSGDQCDGKARGAHEPYLTEGPRLSENEALRDHGDVLVDEDSDVVSDYIDHSAFKDVVG